MFTLMKGLSSVEQSTVPRFVPDLRHHVQHRLNACGVEFSLVFLC